MRWSRRFTSASLALLMVTFAGSATQGPPGLAPPAHANLGSATSRPVPVGDVQLFGFVHLFPARDAVRITKVEVLDLPSWVEVVGTWGARAMEVFDAAGAGAHRIHDVYPPEFPLHPLSDVRLHAGVWAPDWYVMVGLRRTADKTFWSSGLRVHWTTDDGAGSTDYDYPIGVEREGQEGVDHCRSEWWCGPT